MKKYFGKREWSETLYHDRLTEEDIKDLEMTGASPFDGFFCPGFFDIEHYFGFIDKNKFEDTNEFTTYSEIFNIYQYGKI